MKTAARIALLLVLAVASSAAGADANRLVYLDDFLEPYYVHRDFPKLTTPQWVGEPGVEAVLVLAVDDMRDPAVYEQFLRPILDRLKQIDGRAAVSIMTNRIEPSDERLAKWLEEGLSLDVHTYDHPCPCLQQGNFEAARTTYERCVDMMFEIPGNRPVAFRMPCCDSQNTPSPRFWAEIFNRTTPAGNFLTIDSSVFQIFTSDDPALPRELVLRDDGSERFKRYVPFPSFVNTIENYPYPYVIGRLGWQFPCTAPSDWEAQFVQQPNNPETVRDMQLAIDATVLKQGVFDLVFHPHNWIRNDQVVQLIDHAVSRHGNKVKVLTFREADERLREYLLGGQSLRDAKGRDNGVRLLDLNNDGYLDVVIGNTEVRQTRIWDPAAKRWNTSSFPTRLVALPEDSTVTDPGARARFGIAPDGSPLVLLRTESEEGAWYWTGSEWQRDDRWLAGLEIDGKPVFTSVNHRDQGVRLRDVDGDGRTELLVANPQQRAVFTWDGEHWQRASYSLPESIAFVDAEGRDAGVRFVDLDQDGLADLVYSDARRYGVYLARFDDAQQFAGWPVVAQEGDRGEGEAIPMIVRQGTNNGAWFHSEHLWVQNEDTHRLPDNVDRRSFEALLADEAARPAPRSPENSLRSLRVPAGLKVELVACEPLVQDPVAFDWGTDGRLWVVEMGDYPRGVGEDHAPGGRVKILTDEDGDGRYDRADVFLDGLNFPTGVKVWRSGVLITAAPEIFYAEDKDGDGRADERRTLFTGFVEGNQQHRVNGLRWGLDNWLYVANGDSGGIIESAITGERVPIGGRDLRIRPDEGLIEAESGQTQFGRDRDDWGNWFGGNNSNPIWHYVLPDHYLRRNSHFAPPDPRRQISETPGAAPVFPRSRTLPRFNELHMANRFTSACSPTIYRDRLLGDQYYGNAFISEPVHNLVHRHVLEENGVSFIGRRASDEQDREFLASDDHWFRPTTVRTGPDGALWIADMYRLVIEHPEWIPPEWQARLNLRAGENRGRIYRVVPTDKPPRPIPKLDALSNADLVAQLESPNGWIRDTVQQMLLWRGAKEAAPQLAALYKNSPSPLARLHALATLDGLGELTNDLLNEAIEDSEAGVRRHAVRLAAPRLNEAPELAEKIAARLPTEPPAVQLQILFAAGESDAPIAARFLSLKSLDDPLMMAAAISSLNAAHVRTLLSNTQESPHPTVLTAALQYAAAERDYDTLLAYINGWRAPANANELAARLSTIAEILGSIPADERARLDDAFTRPLSEHVAVARDVLGREDAAPEHRRVAVRVLARANWDYERMIAELCELLAPQYPPEVQQAAVEGLAPYADPAIADRLLNDWRSHTPALRAQILDAIMARTTWIERLLDGIESERIPAAHIDGTRRAALASHRSPRIRERSARILAAAIQTDRQTVIDRYAQVTKLKPDPEHGRAVFRKHCSVCHRLEEHGFAVGPDLNALTDKSPSALLTAILDPNRAVEDKFLEYLAVGADGRQHLGMIASETSNAVTLLAQEGKQTVLLRNELESLSATGRSLMPEGLERELSEQDVADVIAYLRATREPPKSFPGNEPQVAEVGDDGSIRMNAHQGRIYGPTLVLEAQYKNVGYWGSPEDRIVWDVRVPRAGSYLVTLDYACADETAGNRVIVEVAGTSTSGTVQGTGGWESYSNQQLGVLELPAGNHELTVRSDGPINGHLMDLRGVTLVPQ